MDDSEAGVAGSRHCTCTTVAKGTAGIELVGGA